ncbi:phosphopantetheine-binding protein [Mycoplasma sp. Mirounga ES2805-ORL]|uniref:phosphopantetheine-binding protein n=1 Tax=Mycoplasma sp. Mirounga ES2805-ORL TaxID=754514 RepID=UPI00197C7109|nr:phosphopantetheine-binding protein [Mycoplasma sp. Mirounga ES2805-ORL]QSF13551.1 acyl carrier protein [Mycoplasma sp. Mirounga ES2805-ORL]
MDFKQKIISKLQGLTKSSIKTTSTLKDLKIDSLTLAELVFEAEEEFEIRVEDADLVNIKTVQDIIDVFGKYISKK